MVKIPIRKFSECRVQWTAITMLNLFGGQIDKPFLNGAHNSKYSETITIKKRAYVNQLDVESIDIVEKESRFQLHRLTYWLLNSH